MEEKKETLLEASIIKEIKEAAHDGAFEGAQEGAKKFKGKGRGVSLKTVILLIILTCAACFIVPKINAVKHLLDRVDSVENHDLTLENNGILGFTVADFEEAILGDSSQLKKLVVYSREVSDSVTLTNAGFGGLKVFTKTQLLKYHGVAQYTVDLGELKKESIAYDEENRILTLTIPHSVLDTLVVPEEDIEYGEIKKGALSFGKITLTKEESDTVNKEAKNKMKEKLTKEKVADEADRFAKMSVWEIYQPLVSGVAPDVKLEIEFAD